MPSIDLEATREEQARVELGRTTIAPSLQRALTLTFIASSASMIVIQTILGVGRLGPGESWSAAIPAGLRVDRLLPGLEQLRSVRDPRSALDLLPSVDLLQRFEESLEEQSVLRSALLPPIQAWLTGTFGVGNEGAVVGEQGWLFHQPDIDYITAEPFLDRERLERLERREGRGAGPRHDPLPAILDLQSQLERRGIALVVLPVPGKPQIHPQQLFSSDAPPAGPLQNPSCSGFLRRLKEHGVRVFDPGEILFEITRQGRAAYLPTDTHWTSEAMQAVARQLANVLTAEGLVAAGRPGTYASRALEFQGPGDIATMLRLPAGSGLFPPESVRIAQVFDPELGETWRPQPGSSVLLLGDSFTNIYSLPDMGFGSGGGLAEHLSLTLQLPLDRISRNGGGALSTREALATEVRRSSSVDRLASTKVVIYQFAERELLVGDWQVVPLPEAPVPRGAVSGALPHGAPVRVSASIAQISRPPEPSGVAYKDAVIGLHLLDVSPRGSDPVPNEIVAYALGMQDRRWSELVELQVGDRVELDVVPWERVKETYDGLNRIELDDPDFVLIDLQLYWATLGN